MNSTHVLCATCGDGAPHMCSCKAARISNLRTALLLMLDCALLSGRREYLAAVQHIRCCYVCWQCRVQPCVAPCLAACAKSCRSFVKAQPKGLL